MRIKKTERICTRSFS